MAKEFIFRAWFISQLRRISSKYPAVYLTLNAAKREGFVPSKHGKPLRRVWYTCAQCKQEWTRKFVAVDHIEPVVSPETGFPTTSTGGDNWNVYISRLFCDMSKLQVLCKYCHNIKTLTENAGRKKKVAKKRLTHACKKRKIKKK